MNEQTPLLAQHSSQFKREENISLSKELKLLGWRTVPICASFALQNIVQATSVIIAGSISPFAMEVTSYGFMFFSCTGTMIGIGGATALDTLCSHALSDDPQRLGILLRQCILVLVSIFLVLIAPLWIFSTHLFVALGQERAFASATGKFMLLMIPAGILQVCAESFKKFLQVQGASSTVTMMTFAASLIGILINSILVQWTRLGIWSGPAAFGAYQLLTALLLVGTALYFPTTRKSLKSSPTRILKGLPRFSFYAVTGICTIATEWWSFEILAMLAARLDRKSIGAQSILMSSDLLLTTVSLGISVAASHRVGELLGANRGRHARLAAFCPYILSLIIGGLECIIIMSLRNQYGRLFTGDKGVVARTAEVLPLMAMFQVLDLTNGGAGGILRGAGKNHLSGMCNFVAYYGIGLTSAWLFCFRLQSGLFGLWAGIILGSGFLLLLQTLCVWWIRWDELGQRISRSSAD